MSDLPAEHKKSVLDHLNHIAPDTFDEGEFGRWRFSSLAREGSRWRVGFENSGAPDGDVVSFAFEGDCVDEQGIVRSEWFEALNDAVMSWESEQSDWG
jgi:hypothetical protein